MFSSSINIKHQHSSRLYWGIHNSTNEPVWIGDIKVSGLDCDCRCAACGEVLEAHLGSVRKHHFQHNSNDKCVYGNEIAEYIRAKLILDQQQFIELPAVGVSIGQHNKAMQDAQMVKISAVHINQHPNHYPPLLLVETEQRPVRIILDFEDYYTKADLELFEAEAKRNDWDCLGISLPDTSEGHCVSAELLCKGTTPERYWIHSCQAGAWSKELAQYAVAPEVQYEVHGTGNSIWRIAEYDCFLHLHEFNGRFYAREEDCEKCIYNLATTPRCLCLASSGIREPQDLGRSIQERMAEVMRIRQENEEQIRQYKNRMKREKQAPKPAPALDSDVPLAWLLEPPATKATSDPPPQHPPKHEVIEDTLHAGYQEIKDSNINSPRPIADRQGNFWHYCIRCCQWKLRSNMAAFGGAYGPVKGECKKCHKDKIQAARRKAGLI